MEDLPGLLPARLREGVVTSPVELTASQAAREEAADTDDQLAALHEAGHAVLACLAASPPIPVSAIDIRSRVPRVELAEGDQGMPRWRSGARQRGLVVFALGGWAAETVVLGEATLGSDDDLSQATSDALELIAHGLGGEGVPFISWRAFGGYGELPVPTWLADALAQATLRVLDEARATALELARAHRDQIVAVSRIVYRERRLTDGRVTEALRSVGLEPAPIRA